MRPGPTPVPIRLPRRDALALLGGAAAAAAWPGCVQAAPAEPGQRVSWPEVTLLDGSRWGAAQARDKAVIVVFWSTTCPFCLRHNAHVEKLRRAAAGRALEILTVARERDPAPVRAYVARHGYGFQVTLDQGPMGAALSTRRVIPLTAVVERSGRLRQVIPGEMFEEDVMELLRLA
jgi:thiol-disulfide isomerase/thioredoxin